MEENADEEEMKLMAPKLELTKFEFNIDTVKKEEPDTFCTGKEFPADIITCLVPSIKIEGNANNSENVIASGAEDYKPSNVNHTPSTLVPSEEHHEMILPDNLCTTPVYIKNEAMDIYQITETKTVTNQRYCQIRENTVKVGNHLRLQRMNDKHRASVNPVVETEVLNYDKSHCATNVIQKQSQNMSLSVSDTFSTKHNEKDKCLTECTQSSQAILKTGSTNKSEIGEKQGPKHLVLNMDETSHMKIRPKYSLDKSSVLCKCKKNRVELKHQKRNPRQQTCKLCKGVDKQYSKNNTLKEHVQTIHENGMFVCNDCTKAFLTKEGVKEHIFRYHMKASDFVFNCNKCAATFTTKGQLSYHTNSKHPLKTFICESCGKHFIMKHKFLAHQRVHSGEKPVDPDCQMNDIGIFCHCQQCSSKLSNFNMYQKQVPEVGYNCEVCGAHCVSEIELNSHRMNHFTKKEQPKPTCPHCQKQYSIRYSLTEHIKKVHENERFECNDCTKVFRSKKQVKSHIFHIHMKVFDTEFKCNTCAARFTTKAQISYHKNTKHPCKSFVCESCGKHFILKTQFLAHQRVHSGEKTFVCKICGKCFRTYSNLHQHSWTHSERRPYQCDLCDKAFKIRNHLRQHLAVHGMINTSTKKGQRKK